MSAVSALTLEWAQAARALPGQAQIGDAAWVGERPSGVRVAVIDGLGHGREAALASELAIASLAGHLGLGLEAAFAALDQDLKRSRGAALSLADLDLQAGRLRWSGVGNVEGAFIRGKDPQGPRERLMMQSGIVGSRLPRLQVRELALEPGDLLFFYTDGIDSQALRSLDWRLPLQESLDALLAAHARPNDDALLWLGRFHG